jgi:hypothetical protein
MAQVLRDDRVVSEPRDRDTVVVSDSDRSEHHSNTGLIVLGVIILLIILFLFAGNPFGGSGGTNVNVDQPTPSLNTGQ